MTNIQHGGYVVCNNEAIYGVGATSDAAWTDLRAQMDAASITLLADDDDSGEQLGSWCRASDFTIRSASAALIAKVQREGGNIAWDYVGGVACICDEVKAGA